MLTEVFADKLVEGIKALQKEHEATEGDVAKVLAGVVIAICEQQDKDPVDFMRSVHDLVKSAGKQLN